jgi:hypothetical protein
MRRMKMKGPLWAKAVRTLLLLYLDFTGWRWNETLSQWLDEVDDAIDV